MPVIKVLQFLRQIIAIIIGNNGYDYSAEELEFIGTSNANLSPADKWESFIMLDDGYIEKISDLNVDCI